jgi:hypothetical protein
MTTRGTVPLRQRLRRLLPLAALLAALAALRTDRAVEAARPGDLARLVPGNPVVLLETDDLPGLVARWRDCELRPAVEASEAYQRCHASRLGMRLSERVGLLDAALSEPASLDRLAGLPGNRGGLALYNVGETTYLFWLRTHTGAGRDLAVLRPDLDVERTRRGGHEVLIHRGTEDTSPLALAVVGDLLILGNDIARVEEAIALAAGDGGQALASDATYLALARRAPEGAQAHIYLDMSRLLATRQFRRYWVHDNVEDLSGIDRVMLSVTWEQGRTVEHRVLAYVPDEPRLPAGAAATVGAEDRFGALPAGAYSALSTVSGPDRAAFAARWIWPGASDGNLGDLTGLLGRARPARMVEVSRPTLGRDGFSPQDEHGVAFLLGNPAALSDEELASAASAAMSAALSTGRRVVPEERRVPGRGVVATALAAPLPGSPRLAISRSADGAVLVLATSARLAVELAVAAEPSDALGEALRVPGPDLARVSFDAAGPALRQRLDLITTDEEMGRYGALAFLGEEIPELLEIPGIATIERRAWRDGDLDLQEVRYIE